MKSKDDGNEIKDSANISKKARLYSLTLNTVLNSNLLFSLNLSKVHLTNGVFDSMKGHFQLSFIKK